MSSAIREVLDSWRSAPIFSFYVFATLVVASIIGLITFEVIDLGMNHFGDVAHRTHDISFGLLFATAVLGVLVQVRRPLQNVAGMVIALIPILGLLLAGALADDIGRVVRSNPFRYSGWVIGIAALLHPAGSRFFRSFSLSRISGAMLALTALAAVPLIGMASTNLRLQTSVTDMHVVMGHYGFMAAFSFTVIGLCVLASCRPTGWRVAAWTGGALPAVLGITSLAYPDASSSLDIGWAIAAIAWGTSFVAVAERTRGVVEPPPENRRSSPSDDGRLVTAR